MGLSEASTQVHGISWLQYSVDSQDLSGRGAPALFVPIGHSDEHCLTIAVSDLDRISSGASHDEG